MVEGVTTDAQLGEFYAENGFMPELDNLPDSVFQLLDFDKLGEKMRFEDGGILVNRGYVAQHADLKQVYDCLLYTSISIGSRNITTADLAYPELVTDEAFQLIICALLLAKYGDAILNLEGKTGDIKQ